MRKGRYVLDSYALLAYLQAERGGAKVRDLLREARKGATEVFFSPINLGEVVYVMEQRLGREGTLEILDGVLKLPIRFVEVSLERVLSAAHIKACYAVAYADAFAIALAEEFEATVVTGDPEFRQVETLVDILWL